MQFSAVTGSAGYTRNTMGPLHTNPNPRCARCLGSARPYDERTVKEIKVDDEKREAVQEFCYLWER